MANIKQRIAQQWPRVTVGLYAVWGLLNNLAALWLGIQLNSFVNNRKFLGAYNLSMDSGMGPEEEDRVIKITLIIFGTIFALFNATALYAAVRKSVTAAKTSLIIWIVQMSWAAIALVLVYITLMGMPESDRDQIPRPSTGDCVMVGAEFLLTMFHGWALFVYLRDLKDRQRNVWGFLVKTGGVFEYEPVNKNPGPVHL
ncbi:hypothetical protein BGZ95_010903 [Linnemannia exigua]|uniref:Uncharacterized protein n=1 Tax=Linnemannia exigua TaxID=604196 RepID=A0AAD4H5N2_9FUNG|nr:hypothetical protein BGZ95_010903 [Linnemannia exigua]